jgi:hypothetical protein
MLDMRLAAPAHARHDGATECTAVSSSSMACIGSESASKAGVHGGEAGVAP